MAGFRVVRRRLLVGLVCAGVVLAGLQFSCGGLAAWGSGLTVLPSRVDASATESGTVFAAADMNSDVLGLLGKGDLVVVTGFSDDGWLAVSVDLGDGQFPGLTDGFMLSSGVYVPVVSVSVSDASLKLTVGGSVSVKAVVYPGCASNPRVSWSSSDGSVAGVSGSGRVEAVGQGSAVVKATADGVSASVKVRVSAPPLTPVGGVLISEHEVGLMVGEAYDLQVLVQPSDASDKSVFWSSSDPGVVLVDQSGRLVGLAAGSVSVVVTSHDGGFTDACTVMVTGALPVVSAPVVSVSSSASTPTASSSQTYVGVSVPLPVPTGGGGPSLAGAGAPVVPVSGVLLDHHVLGLQVGSGGVLVGGVLPVGASDQGLVWWSSDPVVVDVDQSGEVTGMSVGSATVTVASADGGFMDSCVVTVTLPSVPGLVMLASPVDSSTTSAKSLSVYGLPDTGSQFLGSLGKKTPVTVTGFTDDGWLLVEADLSDDGLDGLTTGFMLVDKVYVPVVSVSLSDSSVALSVGGSVSVSATVYPACAMYPDVTWSADDESVASVDGSGEIRALRVGSTVVRGEADGVSSSLTVNVSPAAPVGVTGVSLSAHVVSVALYGSQQLTATVNPSNATNKTLFWSSSDSQVATVDQSGKVTALALGSATIMVTTYDGGHTDSCRIDVIDWMPVTSVSLTKTVSTLASTGVETLIATINPATASNKTLTWSSSDIGVVMVNTAGQVSAVGPGVATVTVTTNDGGKTANCVYTVTGVLVTPAASAAMNGYTVTLTAAVFPASASQTVTWASGNTKATVPSTSGVVTAAVPATGTSANVTITATSKATGAIGTAKVHVYSVQNVQTQLNSLNCKGTDGKSSLTVDGSFGANSLAAFQAFQAINARTLATRPHSADLLLMFSPTALPCGATPPTGVTVAPVKVSIMTGMTTTLKAIVTPAKAPQTVAWSLSLPGKATVSAAGVVTGTATGVGGSSFVNVTATAPLGYTALSQVMVYSVEDIKTKLASLGCKAGDGNTLSINATFDLAATAALNRFQQTSKLASTVKPDGQTLDLLFSPTALQCPADTSKITLTGGLVLPASIVEKTNEPITGTVTSTPPLKSLTAQILGNDGTTVIRTCTLNATGYSAYGLSECDGALAIKTLPAGGYFYTVTASNSIATNVILTYQEFKVITASSSVSCPTCSNGYVPYSLAKTINGGNSTGGKYKSYPVPVADIGAATTAAMVDIATTQVGYHEGMYVASCKDINGEVYQQCVKFPTTDDKGNWTKYYATKPYSGGKANGMPWCAVFVTWVAYQAGINMPIKTTYAGALQSAYVKAKQYYSVHENGYKAYFPKPGDIIFFGGTLKDGSYGILHTGIVQKLVGEQVYTIEGNTDSTSAVKINIYARNANHIDGYGHNN